MRRLSALLAIAPGRWTRDPRARGPYHRRDDGPVDSIGFADALVRELIAPGDADRRPRLNSITGRQVLLRELRSAGASPSHGITSVDGIRASRVGARDGG
jgi:hypothetical protein